MGSVKDKREAQARMPYAVLTVKEFLRGGNHVILARHCRFSIDAVPLFKLGQVSLAEEGA